MQYLCRGFYKTNFRANAVFQQLIRIYRTLQRENKSKKKKLVEIVALAYAVKKETIKKRSFHNTETTSHNQNLFINQILLIFFLAGNREFFSSLCSSCCQNFTTIDSFHSFSETMLIFPASSGRLICPFHSLLYFAVNTLLAGIYLKGCINNLIMFVSYIYQCLIFKDCKDRQYFFILKPFSDFFQFI